MKKYNYSILCIFLFFQFTKTSIEQPLYVKDFYINDIQYQLPADIWSQTYIQDIQGNLLIPAKELQILANLIYFSFQRSYLTLQAQSTAIKTLENIWNGWQNIAQTRLDPSKEIPHEIPETAKRHMVANFWLEHDMHQKMSKTYDKAVQYIIYGNCLSTVNAQNGAHDMRQRSKAAVAQSLADIRHYVGNLFYHSKSLRSGYEKAIQFVDFLYEYLPKVAVNSFIEANKTNDIVSENSWNVLMKIQDVGKQSWQIIEQERAGFYLALYKKIWNIMRQTNLQYEYYKIIFDEYGVIDTQDQYDYLPDPFDLNPEYL